MPPADSKYRPYLMTCQEDLCEMLDVIRGVEEVEAGVDRGCWRAKKSGLSSSHSRLLVDLFHPPQQHSR
jgi:hypothetical protein